MRWFLVLSLIAAVSSDTLLTKKQRKNWPYIKSNIASKLFGRNTAVIVQQPEIPKDKSYQLFKIDGYEDVLINLTRNQELENIVKEEKVTHKEHVKDNPDLAVLSSYLGTKTQEETLQAFQAVDSLLKSGILSAETEDMLQNIVKRIKPFNNNIREQTQAPAKERDPNFITRNEDSSSTQLPAIDIRFAKPKPEQEDIVQKADKTDFKLKTNIDKDKKHMKTKTQKKSILPRNVKVSDKTIADDSTIKYDSNEESPQTVEDVRKVDVADEDVKRDSIDYSSSVTNSSKGQKLKTNAETEQYNKNQKTLVKTDKSDLHVPRERLFFPPSIDNEYSRKYPNNLLRYFA